MPVNDYEPEPLPAEPISADVATPSMIERVARHVATQTPINLTDGQWQFIVRRVMEGMRQPTKAMEQAAAAEKQQVRIHAYVGMAGSHRRRTRGDPRMTLLKITMIINEIVALWFLYSVETPRV